MNPIRFDDVRSWLFDHALPFWASAGVDRAHGGFVEHLDLRGCDAAVPFKRTRAQSRQIYCFSHAALLGWRPGAAISDHGWDFLTAHGRRADGAWVRSMGRNGEVLDPVCDAYDMAFVLLAHAWRYRLTRDPAVRASAMATLDVLSDRLAHPDGLGWFAYENARGPREQNPHMHMTEAALELADSMGEERFADIARTGIDLLRGRFIDRENRVLREYYGAGWSLLDSAQGRQVEPGHMFEWAWILMRAEKLLGIDSSEDAALLFENAERLGVAPDSGLVLDQVEPDGTVRAAASRSWPQTERLKAQLAMFERFGADTRPAIANCVNNLLDRYLCTEPVGTWIDQFDAQGQPQVDKIPSSTFYHLLLAFSELLRLRSRLEGIAG